MAARFELILFESGPTVGVIFNLPLKGDRSTDFDSPINWYQGYNVLATDDTISWAVEVKPSQSRSGVNSAIIHSARAYIPEGVRIVERLTKLPRQGSMTTRHQMLYEWARASASKLIKNHGIAAVGMGMTSDAAQSAPLKALPSLFANDQVSYLGFDSIKRSAAHSLETLHALVLKAQDAALRAWNGWEARNIHIQFHDSKSMGSAWEPGNPTNLAQGRRICLNRKLLTQYDANSIWRVIVHEMCHHAREERERRRLTYDNAHDDLFCRMIVLADPQAIGSQCRFFEAAPDPSLVSVTAKAQGKQPVYDPALGTLLLSGVKNGGMRMRWISKTPELRWQSPVLPIGDESLLEMLKRFAPSTWGDVEVSHGDKWRATFVTSLGSLASYLIRAYPAQVSKTREFVASSGVFTEVSRAS